MKRSLKRTPTAISFLSLSRVISISSGRQETAKKSWRSLRPGGSPAKSIISPRGGGPVGIGGSEPGEVIEIDCERLLSLIQTDSELSDIFLRAFILRRVELITRGIGNVVLIGSVHSLDSLRIKEFLTRNDDPYSYIDLDRDADVQDLMDRFHVAVADLPVLICRGQVVLR